MTINNILLTPAGNAVESSNNLQATINGIQFNPDVVGGRYDGEDHPEKWTKRYSWGTGPLSAGDSLHTLIFITCDPGMVNGQEYDLSQANIPVGIQFSDVFPPEHENEDDYLKPVLKGKITLTHDFSLYLVTGHFSFEFTSENSKTYTVENGTLSIGPN
ncbi:hypothetical protein [Pseudocitrobacter cyperus]|uniref:Uncharacterized protein n=1 Tax=Pseudocitrobacter cyperus TaxID=3112843 RepID=A0ABV0HE20_9ENTR